VHRRHDIIVNEPWPYYTI